MLQELQRINQDSFFAENGKQNSGVRIRLIELKVSLPCNIVFPKESVRGCAFTILNSVFCFLRLLNSLPQTWCTMLRIALTNADVLFVFLPRSRGDIM